MAVATGPTRTTHYSVMAPVAPLRYEHLLPYAALVQWSQARRLWQGQTMSVDPHLAFASVAAAGFRVPVGTGVTLMPLRHPIEAAIQARTLATITGHPLVAGFGPGAAAFQAGARQAPYRRPVQASREYIDTVRRLLDNELVELDGQYVKCGNALPPLPSPHIEVGLGVLRSAMSRLAGEVADVAITWLTPPTYISDVIAPAIAEGAAAVGRATRPRIVAMVPVAVERKDRDLPTVVLASNMAHMQLPHYADMLAQSGIHYDLTDPRRAAEQLAKGKAFISGSIDQVAHDLSEFADAGVDEIVLNVSGVCQVEGAGAAMRELELLLEAVHP